MVNRLIDDYDVIPDPKDIDMRYLPPGKPHFSTGQFYDMRRPSEKAYRGYKAVRDSAGALNSNVVPYGYDVGPTYTPNFTIAGTPSANVGAAPKSKVGGWFDTVKGVGSNILGDIMFPVDNFFNPNAGGGVSYGLGTKSTGGLGKAGLNLGKHNLGRYATGVSGIMQGLDAIGGFSEMSDLNKDADDLTNQILASASGNPLLHSYLTSDDLALLGKLQRGNFDASGSFGDATSNIGNLLSGTLSGVASGALGGIPGMVVGGIGGLLNSGIDNVNSATSNNTARLEALYQNLLNAEQQYKSMRRPNFSGLGIQQRYQNMYA